MRDPRGVSSALRLTAALVCSSLLAACGGSAGDRSSANTPSDPAPAPDEAGAEQNPATPVEAGDEVSSPLPEPVSAAQPPGVGPRCDTPMGTYTFVQSRAELEAFAGCEVLRGFIEIHITEGMDLTALSSLRVVEGSLLIGSNPVDPDAPASPVRLSSLRGLERLERARDLYIQHAEGGLGPLASLRDVEALGLADLPGVVDLRDLSSVRVTRALNLESMPDLVSLQGLAFAPALDELLLFRMPRLESLAGMAGVESVRALMLDEAPALKGLALPDSLTALSQVTISGAPLVTSLAELSRFSTIEDLRVSGSPLLTDLGGGGVASGALRVLGVGGAPLLTTLDPVGGLAGLVELDIGDCDGLTDLDELVASPALQYLRLSENDGLTRLPTFDQAGPEMRMIRILNNRALIEGPSFPNLTRLNEPDAINYEQAELEVTGNPALRSMGSFPRLESANMVTIADNSALESALLPSLQQLAALRITSNEQLSQLELNVQRKLHSVELDTNPVLDEVQLGAPATPLLRLTLRNTPQLAADIRQLLLGLVDEQTLLTLD